MSDASEEVIRQFEAAKQQLFAELEALDARRREIRRALGSPIRDGSSFHGRNKVVMEYVAGHPDCTGADIAKDLSMPAFDVQVCLHRLRKRGFVDRSGTGANGYVQLRAAKTGQAAEEGTQ